MWRLGLLSETFAGIVLGVASVAVSLPLGAYVQAVGRWAQIGAIYAGTAFTALTLTKLVCQYFFT